MILVHHPKIVVIEESREKVDARKLLSKRNREANRLEYLGIPVIIDRCLQAMVKNALEPVWEAQFEGSSYGFRPGRSSQDAIGKIYLLACPNKNKKWVFDADIKGAFDNISHDHLLKAIVEGEGENGGVLFVMCSSCVR